MLELGKRQRLQVQRIKEFGVYLGEDLREDQSVLLPKKQVPEGTAVGTELDVFLYKDSDDRLIATTAVPYVEVGGVAALKVKEVTKIGAFLDMGLEKDLLLPYKEQAGKVKEGDTCLVALYVDKSKRLAATMKVYSYLDNSSPYEKDSKVTGTVYEISDELGAFVAVDNRYYGLIPRQELYGSLHIGEQVEARVLKVREDGKLDLSAREKAYVQMDADASFLLEQLNAAGGNLPFHDKSDPELIKQKLHMSKNAFKRAAGRLLKEGKIQITEQGIELI